MRKKLLAYTINGRTYTSETEYYDWEKIIGIDINTWYDSDLNGNEAFKVILSGETSSSGYTDITSIQNWYDFGLNIANDYLVPKFEIRELVKEIGWSGLTNTEKDIAILTYSYDNMLDAVTYLMTEKGMNQYQAQGYLLQEWHKHHGRLVDTCKSRWFYVKFIIAQYLSFADAEELLDECQLLILSYIECGRLGTQYGDNNNGIMDYLESTGTFIDQGLRESGYVLQQGNWDIFIGELNNVLVQGIYNKYKNEF
jgi:hypothetical protein